MGFSQAFFLMSAKIKSTVFFSARLNLKLKVLKWHKQQRHHPVEIPQLNKLECPKFTIDTSTLKTDVSDSRKKDAHLQKHSLFTPFFSFTQQSASHRRVVADGQRAL